MSAQTDDRPPICIRLNAKLNQEIERIKKSDRRSSRSDTIRALLGEAIDSRKSQRRRASNK